MFSRVLGSLFCVLSNEIQCPREKCHLSLEFGQSVPPPTCFLILGCFPPSPLNAQGSHLIPMSRSDGSLPPIWIRRGSPCHRSVFGPSCLPERGHLLCKQDSPSSLERHLRTSKKPCHRNRSRYRTGGQHGGIGSCSLGAFGGKDLLEAWDFCDFYKIKNYHDIHHILSVKMNHITESIAQFSHSVVSDSLQPHRLQHTGFPCPSPTPGVYSNLRP